MGSLQGRGAMSPSGPMMGGGGGPNQNNQRFGSGSAYTPGGQPGQPGYDDRTGGYNRGPGTGQNNMLLDPNLQGSGISMGHVGANQGYAQPGRGTNLGDQFMRNQGSVVDRSRSRGATSRGGGIRGQSVVSGQYLPEGADPGRASYRDDRASLFDVVHGTSQSRAIGDGRCKLFLNYFPNNLFISAITLHQRRQSIGSN